MSKLLCIVGPTGIGKTALAVKVANRLGGALINSDSRQVYKNLNIISGKDLSPNPIFYKESLLHFPKKYSLGYYLLDNSQIYLLDIAGPEYNFTVSDFVRVAIPTVALISDREMLPVIVGGSGFYIKALLDGIETINIPPNQSLRKKLAVDNADRLQEKLRKIDLQKFLQMNESDRKNKRRLIRAVEVAEWKRVNSTRDLLRLEGYDVLMIGLRTKRENIKKRIDARIEKRLTQGAFGEAKKLFEKYKYLNVSVRCANGYKQFFEHFQGKYSLNETIERWRRAEYLNAKKQVTWFGKNGQVLWFDIEAKDFQDKVFNKVEKWLCSE